MYAAPRIMPVVMPSASHVDPAKVPSSTRNSATKPLVAGRPIDAIVNSRKNRA